MRINAKILMAKDNDTYCILKVGTNASYEDLLKKIIKHNKNLSSRRKTVKFIFVKNVFIVGIQQK